MSQPIKIPYNNASDVFYFKTATKSNSFKYIEIKYLMYRDKIKEGQLVIEHITIEAMVAGLLTKDLAPSCS